MKKNVLLWLPVIAVVVLLAASLPKSAHAATDIPLNSSYFPDYYFRMELKARYDENGDNYLSYSERMDITSLDVDDWDVNITSLDGIENLKAVKYLSCDGLNLTTLDLTHNTSLISVSCSGCSLTALYVSGSELKELDCSYNQLPGLDVSSCPNLENLMIEGNPAKKINILGTKLAYSIQQDWFSDVYGWNSEGCRDSAPAGQYGIFEVQDSDYTITVDEQDEDWEYYEIIDPDFYWWERLASFDQDDVIITYEAPDVTEIKNDITGIEFTWKGGAYAIKCGDTYEVYRSPKGVNDFQLIHTDSNDAYSNTYKDTDAVPGKAYSYRICTRNGPLYSKNYSKTLTAKQPFKDVSSNASYFNAVMWAARNGITSGTSSTTFSPNADCVRYQFAVMLYKYAGKPSVSGSLPFKDVSKKASYYNAVLWAYKNGIISGTSKTTFSPNDPVLRYQAVAMLYKLAGKPSVSGSLSFKDVKKSASYYNAVLWAVKNGITKGTDSTHFSPNAVCKRYQLVVFLYKYNNIK